MENKKPESQSGMESITETKPPFVTIDQLESFKGQIKEVVDARLTASEMENKAQVAAVVKEARLTNGALDEIKTALANMSTITAQLATITSNVNKLGVLVAGLEEKIGAERQSRNKLELKVIDNTRSIHTQGTQLVTLQGNTAALHTSIFGDINAVSPLPSINEVLQKLVNTVPPALQSMADNLTKQDARLAALEAFNVEQQLKWAKRREAMKTLAKGLLTSKVVISTGIGGIIATVLAMLGIQL